ncbi:alpha/beta hydrolase [soil metagenome]
MTETLIPFTSADGLALAARDFGGRPDAPTVLCLHGLTRNSKDFAGLAAALISDYRVIAPDQRGRGRSAYDPQPLNYNLIIQSNDVWTLLDRLAIDKVAIVGTSMGALMSIIMANTQPDRIAGLILNDAGPVVGAEGLARIAGYVGKSMAAADWTGATAALKAVHTPSLPTYTDADWLRMARNTYIEDPDGDGGLRLDYDPNLAKAFATDNGVTPDLWAAFEVLASIPALVTRGAHSDILAAETAAAMAERFPLTTVATVPDRGHAPDLTEPEAVAPVAAFLRSEAVRARW